ncbi:MAG: hypothetical protein J6Y61_06080 [Bacteroidales bacterium]|nr:hypothetical protein [Bacteroidales bacterium]
MSVFHNFINSLWSFRAIIILAFVIILALIVLIIFKRKNKNSSSYERIDAKSFFKDFLLPFEGENYTITFWFSFIMVFSIIIGLLGLKVGTPSTILHSHLFVLGLLFLWAVLLAWLLYMRNPILRSSLFWGVSIGVLIACFFLFDWPANDKIPEDKYGYVIGLAGYAASAIGVYVSIRVYMQIDSKNKTNSIEQYLRETIAIIKNAKPGDEVYIIAPSFCIGINSSDYLLNSMYDLLHKKAQSGVLFKLAFTDIHNDKNNQDKELPKKLIKLRPANDHHWGFICELLDTIPIQSAASLLKRMYYDNNSYYKQLVNTNGVSIQWLNLDYLHHNEHANTNNYSGFFASANLGRPIAVTEREGGGDCYLGSFYVSSNKLYFVGSGFNNSSITSGMLSLIQGECEKYKLRH